MRKNIIVCILMVIVNNFLYAQSPDPSILKIKGTSRISVKPGLAVISLTIRTIKMDYTEAVNDLTSRIDLLANSLRKKGFKDTEIITNNFNISRNTVYQRGTRMDSGYVANQTLSVRFDYDKKRFLSVLNNTINSKANASTSISFELTADQQNGIKDKLITMAVADAHKKAGIIADASGYIISSIREIAYDTNENRYRPMSNTISREMTLASTSEVSNFEAAALEYSDEVFIVFEITAKE